jgi:hypothetical protein
MAFAISEIDLYEILRTNMGDESAKALVSFVDSKVSNGFENKKDVLASKQDMADLRVEISQLDVKLSETKAEIIKWMFIFLIGQAAAIIGVLKLLH